MRIFSDCPPPPLYVAVYKDSKVQHTVHGIFRGTPTWHEVHCHNYAYARLRTDIQAIELMIACAKNGGMDESARAQFKFHKQRAAFLRAFDGAVASSVGKVVN